MHRFDLATLPAMPWKNGGGTTREIACQPPGSDLAGFDWRASLATIAGPGPFSTFDGIDRVIVLLAGDGVRLRGDGIDHRVETPLAPFEFPGELAVDCRLLGGPSTDFNLMTRRGRTRAEVQVLREARHIVAAPGGVLLAVGGAWQCSGDGGPVQLPPDHGVWWQGAARGWQAEPESAGAALIAVRIETEA